MDIVIIILIIIIIIIIIGVIIWFKTNKPNKKVIIVKENDVQGFANVDDEYIKPYIIKNFISRDKCKEIISYANSRLTDSKVVGGVDKAIRNSKQYWIPKSNPIAQSIFLAASQYFNIPVKNAEDLQVVRYQPGQYYNQHHDACCTNDEKCRDFVKRGGQRKLTILIYLNSEFSDGETSFPNLKYKIKPEPGDAIVFHPLEKNSSKCHPLALHAGLPVSNGEKWIANIWFRENEFI